MNFSKITGGYRTKLIISAYKNWIKPNESILDVGCGTGIITKALEDYFSTNITGCDIKNYLIYKIPFLRIKDNKIPVKDARFSIALLNDVLHHVPKQYQADVIKETTRVAKKVLVFEFEPTVIGKLADIILNKFHYGDLKTPLSVRSINEWQNLFRKLSLKSQTIRLNKPFWYPFSHIAFMVTK
ncbi:MAG: class I SAM-dependent methyltransferase [Candidatus Daviesbacteria bacterium]|nr:class I SAM-dependent methyltransferase [Candidatus Daviesbacteria bacterium]